MTKNIAVIDEQGNRYEATYLKRAKGLVKSGRARFVDEKTICLARPPDKSEDKTMSENMGSINYSSEDRDVKKADLKSLGAEGLSVAAVRPEFVEGLEKLGEAQRKTDEEQEKQFQEKALSREIVEQVLDQLDHFAADDAYIGKLAEEHFDSEDMTNIVGLREATRQRHLEVYKTVLLKALENEANARTSAFKQLQMVADWIADLDRSNYDEDMWRVLKNKLMDSIGTVAVTDTIR